MPSVLKDTRHMPGVFYDPYENRTRDCALRGRRLNRLTNGPYLIVPQYYISLIPVCQEFFLSFPILKLKCK